MATLPKNPKDIGATIIIEATGTEFHTVRDWGLTITNSVSISEPEQETKYINVPGANSMLDVSEALTGRPVFKKRKIAIDLAGIDLNEFAWDATISGLRNSVEGRIVHIIFDNDETFYWKGRAHITGYDRAKTCGMLTLELPDADPYKYNINSNVDPWLWDPFDFENDIVPAEPIIDVNGTESVTIPAGYMPTCPRFTVTNMTTPIVLTANGRKYTMKDGDNYFPALMINGDSAVVMTYTGVGKVLMEYRGGSL